MNNGDPTLGAPRSLAADCAVTFGHRFPMLVVECAPEDYHPLEPAEDDVRSIVTECPDVRAVHGKAPLGRPENRAAPRTVTA